MVSQQLFFTILCFCFLLITIQGNPVQGELFPRTFKIFIPIFFVKISYCLGISIKYQALFLDSQKTPIMMNSQVPRFHRFNIPSFPNEKRSDFDDPRFFSSAYGKRSGGQVPQFNPELFDFQL